MILNHILVSSGYSLQDIENMKEEEYDFIIQLVVAMKAKSIGQKSIFEGI